MRRLLMFLVLTLLCLAPDTQIAQDTPKSARQVRKAVMERYLRQRAFGLPPDYALQVAMSAEADAAGPFAEPGKLEEEAKRVREHMLQILFQDFPDKPDTDVAKRAYLKLIAEKYSSKAKRDSASTYGTESRQEREGFKAANEFLKKALPGGKLFMAEAATERGRVMRGILQVDESIVAALEMAGLDPVEATWTAYGWYLEQGYSPMQAARLAARVARELGASPAEIGEFLSRASAAPDGQYRTPLFDRPDLGTAIMATATLQQVLSDAGDLGARDADSRQLQDIYVSLRELQETYEGLEAVLPVAETSHSAALRHAEDLVSDSQTRIQRLRFALAVQTTLLDWGKLLVDIVSVRNALRSIAEVRSALERARSAGGPEVSRAQILYSGGRALIPSLLGLNDYRKKIQQYFSGTRLETPDDIGIVPVGVGLWPPLESTVRTFAQERGAAFKNPEFRAGLGLITAKLLHKWGTDDRDERIRRLTQSRGDLTAEEKSVLQHHANLHNVQERMKQLKVALKWVNSGVSTMDALLRKRGLAVPEVPRRALYIYSGSGWGRMLPRLNQRSDVLSALLMEQVRRLRFPKQGVSATSDFSQSAEDWTLLQDAHPLKWSNGAVQGMDISNGAIWAFSAPSKYLGNKGALYGTALKFQLRIDYADVGLDWVDVTLTSTNKKSIMARIPYAPSTSWTSYHVRLDESAIWKTGDADATKADIENVLSSLAELSIMGEFKSGYDTCFLDNVTMGVR